MKLKVLKEQLKAKSLKKLQDKHLSCFRNVNINDTIYKMFACNSILRQSQKYQRKKKVLKFFHFIKQFVSVCISLDILFRLKTQSDGCVHHTVLSVIGEDKIFSVL